MPATACRNGLREDPKIFIAIADDGTVTVLCHRSEMGQGVAHQPARWWWPTSSRPTGRKVKVAQAQGDEPKFGNQDTDGSRSMRHHFMTLRRMGAAARQMLEQAAAKQWGVPVTEVEAVNHEVVHKGSGPQARLWRAGQGGGRAAGAGARQPEAQGPRQVPLHRQGRDPLIDGFDITTGKAHIRHRRPARRHGVRRRRAPAGARRQGQVVRRRRDAEGARACSRSSPSIATPAPAEFQPLGGVAVVATNTWAAIEGPRGAEDRVGRRPERVLFLRSLQGDAGGGGAQARRRGRAQRRRRRGGAGRRRQAHRGGILHPASRARDHGAAGGGRADRGRQVRGLGLRAVAAGDARPPGDSASASRPRT